jgi:hypothetical protein
VADGASRVAEIDLLLGYQDYRLRESPTGTGQMGPIRVAARPLPDLDVIRRCPCPGGPEPGAPPNPGCSLMCR